MRRWARHPETVGDGPLRLGIALALSAAAVGFFLQAAAPGLAASTLAALLVIGAVYLGYHILGQRWANRLWPGTTEGLATGLLFFCLCPPNLPPWLIFLLAAAAVLIDGGTRGLKVPLAAGGIILAWPLAWLWHAHSGLGYLSVLQLRPQLEPIALWANFQLELDPLRLYVGNVAGPLGATSFGLAMLGFLFLAFARKASWPFLVAYYLPIAATIWLAHQSLPVYLISGPAVVFAGLVGADVRRLPPGPAWRVGAGVAAGLLSALLLQRGGGSESYGAGVLGVLLLVSLFQLFGLTGSPAVISAERVEPERPAHLGRLPGQMATLVAFAPLGLVLVWRDQSLPRSQRQMLTGLGLLLYLVAVSGALLWLWALRLPA